MPDPAPAPQAAHNVSANLIRLNMASREIEELKETTRNQQKLVEQMKAAGEKHYSGMVVICNALNIKAEKDAAEIKVLKDRVGFLESLLGVVECDNDPDDENSEIFMQDTDGLSEDERKKLMDSIEAVNSQVIKTAVNKVFAHLMGVPGRTLVARKLPPHPNWPGQDGTFPVDHATQAPLLRFHWDKPGSYEVNATGLNTVAVAVRTLGPRLVPLSTGLIPKLLDAHLEERVAKKFRYLHLSWLADLKEGEGSEEETQGDGDIFGGNQGGGGGQEAQGTGDAARNRVKKPVKAQSASTHNSRVSAKLAIRNQKRTSNEEFSKAKYDAAFTLTATSEDETDDEVLPGMPKAYKTCPPDWQSDLLKNCHTDVDGEMNPGPLTGAKLNVRKQGQVRVGAIPRKALKIENAVRVWMVNPAALAAHPEWITMGFVVANGLLWGDEAEPVLPKASKKRKTAVVSPEGTVGTKKQKRKAIDTSEVEKQRNELTTVTGGQDVRELIAKMSEM